MIYGINRIHFEDTNPIPRPDPKEGFYLYFYADDTELAEIAAFSPDIAALFQYTYNNNGLHYCLATDFYAEDDGTLLDILLNSHLLNYDYFLKSNRPGYSF